MARTLYAVLPKAFGTAHLGADSTGSPMGVAARQEEPYLILVMASVSIL